MLTKLIAVIISQYSISETICYMPSTYTAVYINCISIELEKSYQGRENEVSGLYHAQSVDCGMWNSNLERERQQDTALLYNPSTEFYFLVMCICHFDIF